MFGGRKRGVIPSTLDRGPAGRSLAYTVVPPVPYSPNPIPLSRSHGYCRAVACSSMAAVPLQRLADAYGVASTLDAVADAIILRTRIPAGVNERGPVLEVVAMLVRDPDTLRLIADHEPLPDDLLAEMTRVIDQYGPAMPVDTLVGIVLRDITLALGQAG